MRVILFALPHVNKAPPVWKALCFFAGVLCELVLREPDLIVRVGFVPFGDHLFAGLTDFLAFGDLACEIQGRSSHWQTLRQHGV